ncbi:MAG TPA: hypothetical protein VGK73_12570 [Polyangiaceae bacterium]
MTQRDRSSAPDDPFEARRESFHSFPAVSGEGVVRALARAQSALPGLVPAWARSRSRSLFQRRSLPRRAELEPWQLGRFEIALSNTLPPREIVPRLAPCAHSLDVSSVVRMNNGVEIELSASAGGWTVWVRNRHLPGPRQRSDYLRRLVDELALPVRWTGQNLTDVVHTANGKVTLGPDTGYLGCELPGADGATVIDLAQRFVSSFGTSQQRFALWAKAAPGRDAAAAYDLLVEQQLPGNPVRIVWDATLLGAEDFGRLDRLYQREDTGRVRVGWLPVGDGRVTVEDLVGSKGHELELLVAVPLSGDEQKRTVEQLAAAFRLE